MWRAQDTTTKSFRVSTLNLVRKASRKLHSKADDRSHDRRGVQAFLDSVHFWEIQILFVELFTARLTCLCGESLDY